MIDRLAVIYLMLIFFLFSGCDKQKADLKQKSEISSVELTLPQMPKLSAPYKPTNKDVQIALKNAGLYKGKIDGDIGPKTREAISEFQEQNDLTVDGKVGPKTWSVLKKYLYMFGG